MQLAAPGETPDGSGASADNSLRSAAEALKGTLVNDGKRLEIRHFCFAACGSSVRQKVFAGPKSLDAPEPRLSVIVSGESTKMNPPAYLLIHLQRGHGLYEDQRLIFLAVTRPADFP